MAKNKNMEKMRAAKTGKKKNRHHKLMGLPDEYRPGFLAMLDIRSRTHREITEDYNEIVDDMGGEESLSYLQKIMIERVVFLVFMLRIFEQRILQYPHKCEKSMSKWIHATGSLNSIAQRLGIERRARKVENLKSYLKVRKGKAG